jgi:hypothetical protein
VSQLDFEPPTEEFWNQSVVAYTTVLAWGWDPGDSRFREASSSAIDALACRVLADLVRHCRINLEPGAVIKGFENGIGANLTVHSGPVLHWLEFGVYHEHWFMQLLVPFMDSIPNVTEDFWDTISKIRRTAPTKFEENEVIRTTTAERKRLMQSGRSIQYCIIRNFILRRQESDRQSDDIGHLSSEVAVSEPYETALPRLRRLFKLYHSLLQQLYRPAYQKERRLYKKRGDPGGGGD